MFRRSSLGADEAHLQADVMRFMAIVAFCLLAILALVKDATPSSVVLDTSPVQTPQEKIAHDTVSLANIAKLPTTYSHPYVQDSVSEPIPPEPIKLDEPPAVVEPQTGGELRNTIPEPLPETETRSVIEFEKKPLPQVPDTSHNQRSSKPIISGLTNSDPTGQRHHQNPQIEEVVTYESQNKLEQADEPTGSSRPTAPDQGLSLQFSSQADFLRLMSRGKVKVFAFNADRIMALDNNLVFRPVPSPGQVYEIDAQTIPDQLQSALPGSMSLAKWAVGLSATVQTQIQQLVQKHDKGQLYIDRFEEVHYAAPR